MEESEIIIIKEESEDLNSVPAIIACFLSTFITTVIVLVAIVFVAVRVMGWGLYSVDSSSMTPTYPVDSLIVVQPVDPSRIQVNDVITYVINDSGTLVTHRVTAVDVANETFTTKGDANNAEDTSPVLWGNVVGRVVIGFPVVGAWLRVLCADGNRPVVITVIVLLLVVSYGWDIVVAVRKRKKKAQLAVIEAPDEVTQEEMSPPDVTTTEGVDDDDPE